MSHSNAKLGLKAAGARARLNALSGVRCAACPHAYMVSETVHGVVLWICAFCGVSRHPTVHEVEAYNARVRPHDRIVR